jgi:hypothetical protein
MTTWSGKSSVVSNQAAISSALGLNLADAKRGYAIGAELDTFRHAITDDARNSGTNSPLLLPGILFLHAVAEARQGRGSSALGSVVQGLAIARALSSLYLPDHAMSRALERRGVQVLEWMANHHQFSGANLQQTETVLALERPERIREVFVALRVMSVAEWKAVQARPVGALMGFLGSPKTNLNPEPDWSDHLLARGEATARHCLGQGYRHGDFRDCLDFWQETSAAFELAPGPCLMALDGIAARSEARFPTGSFASTSGAWFPNYFRDVRDDAETIARLRAARVALAILRWRAAHEGNLPDSLAELAPDILPVIPADPFDEHPLRYRRLPQGFIVYSVGPDFTDNGGQRQLAGTEKVDGYDVVFTVER